MVQEDPQALPVARIAVARLPEEASTRLRTGPLAVVGLLAALRLDEAEQLHQNRHPNVNHKVSNAKTELKGVDYAKASQIVGNRK